jgi:hypothetical protein
MTEKITVNLRGQAMHAAEPRHHTYPGFGQTEGGMLGGNDNVDGRGDFKTVAEGQAVYRRDRRQARFKPVPYKYPGVCGSRPGLQMPA